MNQELKEKASAMLIDLYQATAKMDQTSPEYVKAVDTASHLMTAINKADENEIAIEIERAKAEMEASKNLTAVKVEKTRSVMALIGSLVASILGIAGIVLQVKNSAAIAKQQGDNQRYLFDRATAREEEMPITTLTDRTIVQDGLKRR